MENEANFENLMETNEAGEYDPNTITHAMITPDGTTVPITLNPETGQFMTPDGQAVQVQIPEQDYMEEDNETVLPDHTEEVMDQSENSQFQVMSSAASAVVQTQPTVVVKEENIGLMDQSAIGGGNFQVLSGDGNMYFVTSDAVAEAPSAIQMVSEAAPALENPSRIRIVNNEEPRKIITINNQQYVVSQGASPKPSTSQIMAKPKVVIRPAIAPKQEPKVQYVKVVGSRPAQAQTERKVVTIRSGSSLPILPKEAGNVIKIALPTSDGRIQKAQRIILPSATSEAVKVMDQQPPRKIVSLDQGSIVPKIEPSSVVTTTIDSPRPISTPSEKLPDMFETTGVKPRKPCNCTKSQCLKLYCECFANGEFCNNCNCNNCFNNLAHEEARQRSIKQCLERNPNAFRPKIGKLNDDGERRHAKGCNCKRSGCLKNYCECYEAKIGCTKSCRCIGCKNIEVATIGRKPEPENMSLASNDSLTQPPRKSEKPRINPLSSVSGNAFRPVSGVRQPFNFVTYEVVEATCQCLLAQAEEAERSEKKEVETEGLVIEEFGRCLRQIIEMANKSIC